MGTEDRAGPMSSLLNCCVYVWVGGKRGWSEEGRGGLGWAVLGGEGEEKGEQGAGEAACGVEATFQLVL